MEATNDTDASTHAAGKEGLAPGRSVEVPQDTIDPENEVKGVPLLILHTALCIATFLTGLVRSIPRTLLYVNMGRRCATQPLAGKMYVLFPKKTIFLGYLAIFEIGSLICALAASSRTLIVGRAITGLGASGIFAGSLVVITTIMPLHKRPIWQGTLNATFGIASIVGPVLGGALTEGVSWRWCFYINLPIGGFAAAVIVILLHLKPAATEKVPLMQKLKGLDGFGFCLFAGSVTMLLLALQWGGHAYRWGSSTTIGLFVGFGITLPAFVAWQLYLGPHALIPPSIMKNRNIILLFLGALFANGPFQTIIYYLPIWFQVLGASPTSSAVKYLPTVITDVFTSLISGAIVMKTGHWKPFLLFGNAVISIGSGLLTTLHPGTSSSTWIGYQILVGMGYPLVINMSLTAQGQLGVQASLPPDIVHIGSTTLLFGMSISCAISLAIGQAVFQLQLTEYLARSVDPDTVNSVLSNGATHLASFVRPGDLMTVLEGYSQALTDVLFIPTIGPVCSFLIVLFTTWITLKQSSPPTVEIENQEKAGA
ncbi:major facilitator superfamily domain-containing protein [Massariosphaeria phaeospora]|uniref:Major facilitator superfamily domain-containing protein n=1 Tax=Massariosphaeria phaeospora TaxID=100035 RepID=A0A7C8MNH8_9PLEO|nr:major facilitator superfamily domain-containing protein [Massariosphaeria phaeospora]